MAFAVEDGTGVKNANSYATVQGFKDYFGDRQEDVTGIADGDIQDLLVAATDYIDTRWGSRFLGRREWSTLLPRSVLTATDNPSEGETLTFGVNTYTFTASPSADTDVEIGDDVIDTLANLSQAIGSKDPDDFAGSRLLDEDATSVALFGTRNGVATTETMTNGSFDVAATAGRSVRRQPLEFPRVLLRDDSGDLIVGVPEKLRQATYEYAYRANSTALSPDPTVDATGRVVVGNKTKVGPIETDVRFSESDPSVRITKPFPAADRLLREFIRSGGVIRA